MSTILSIHGLTKSFRMGGQKLEVLRGIELEVIEGEILSVVGRSGSGKSTLLHHIGLLDKPDSGQVLLRGESMPLDGARAACARNRFFGFVFQFYHLLPEFSAVENVLMPAMIREDAGSWWRRKRELRGRAQHLMEQVGLKDRMKHKPPQLSGGERQRVAIARGLMNEPELLLCDEPTGNLDRASAESIKELLWGLNSEQKQTMVVVTHDPNLAAEGNRVLVLEDGRLREFEELTA
ncbi:MAG: ABC transporter ATP-binding protein [Planctomycetota bacterium]|jgi:lipoprotein-releasing system ATP-binding protein